MEVQQADADLDELRELALDLDPDEVNSPRPRPEPDLPLDPHAPDDTASIVGFVAASITYPTIGGGGCGRSALGDLIGRGRAVVVLAEAFGREDREAADRGGEQATGRRR